MIRKAKIQMKDENNQDSVVICDGIVRIENDTYYIEYNTATEQFIIGLSDDIVTISKMGDESYTIVMKKQEAYNFGVKTEYGIIKMSMVPVFINHSHRDDGLTLALKYNISPTQNKEDVVSFELNIDCTYID